MQLHAVQLALLLASAAGARTPAAGFADTVYRNGVFYTVSDASPWAEAVAVKDGRFLRVGTNAAMRAITGPATAVVDLGGRFVLPGLIDSHTHPSLEVRDPTHFETGFPWTFFRSHPRLAAWFHPSPAQRVRALADSTRIMSSFGITAIGDGKTEAAQLPAWRQLIRRRELAQHVVLYLLALDVHDPAGLRHAEQLQADFRRFDLPGVRLGAKIVADGNYEEGTAHLADPRGVEPSAQRETVRSLVEELDRAGLMMQIHANGDGAVREALDACEAAQRRRNGRAGPVHALVHARLVQPDDLPRFAALGVGVAVHGHLAQPSPQNAFIEQLIGARRWNEDYLPLRKLWDAGALVGSSSDWASTTMNPFRGMYVGVTRRSPLQPERGRLGEGNALTLEQMIRSYTVNNARLLNMGGEVGSIEPGKWADLAVLDRDILRRPIEELLETRVVMTLFEGRVVYDGRALPAALQRSEERLRDLRNFH